LRDRALGGSGANIAAFDRLVAYLLYRFEAMPFDAFIFVERHGEELVPYPSYLLNELAPACVMLTILSLGRSAMACFEFATELIAAYLAGDLRERKTTAVARIALCK